MSRSVGPTLPPDVRAVLEGTDLEDRIGTTFVLVTSGVDGWPSFALLSVGEVLATAGDAIRLALWPSSTSTANLSAGGRGTLVIVDPGVWYVRLVARRGPDLATGANSLAYFDCRVDDVLEDVVAYAAISGGIRFELPDPGPVLARWRAAIAALAAAAPVGTDGPPT